MEKEFSKELVEAVEKASKTRGIPLVKELVLGSSDFQEEEEINELSSSTIWYVLPNGNCVKKLTQEERKSLEEFAAIVDVEDTFFMVVFVFKD